MNLLFPTEPFLHAGIWNVLLWISEEALTGSGSMIQQTPGASDSGCLRAVNEKMLVRCLEFNMYAGSLLHPLLLCRIFFVYCSPTKIGWYRP